MSAHFKLNFSGLNYLISSSEVCQDRDFLLNILCNYCHSPVSLSSLQLISDMDRKEITKTLYRLLKKGWLSSSEQITESKSDFDRYNFSGHLSELSSTGSAILSDMNGLTISSVGFSEKTVTYLTAYTTNLLKISDAAKKRHTELSNETPWSLDLKWGELNVMVQLIAIGSTHFALIVGGEPKFDNQAFFQLITILAKRYLK